MRKRYPSTLQLLILMTGLAMVVALSLLWRPAIWIIIGVFWLGMLAVAIREDRKRHREGP